MQVAGETPAMFAFLRPRSSSRLGVYLGNQSWEAVLLDESGAVRQRHAQAAPVEKDWTEVLQALLRRFPVESCRVVLTLPGGPWWKVCDWDASRLGAPDLLKVRYESERWLPYSSAEASFGWHVLDAQKTLVTALPSEMLMPLQAAVQGLKPLSQAWEVPQMSLLRRLTREGLPSALLDVTESEVRIGLAAEGEFSAWLRARQESSDSQLVDYIESFLNYLKSVGKAEPRTAITNVPSLLKGWECRPLPADYLAVEVALSPEGTHQIRL